MFSVVLDESPGIYGRYIADKVQELKIVHLVKFMEEMDGVLLSKKLNRHIKLL